MIAGGRQHCISRVRSFRRRALGMTSKLLVIAVAAWAVLAPVEGGLAFGQGPMTTEYQVKAAFLFHFAQFVEWPPEAFKDRASPIVYCTIGEDPFGGALEASLSGKTLGTRSMVVRHLQQPQETQDCQVLFIPAEQKKAVAAALAGAAGRPTLTVGESEHFVAEGGMIGFCLDENKIRFEINLKAAEQSKLKISARLLALAKTVIGGPKGP